MYTVTSIIQDINRGCAINNLNEESFSYRIVFFVNEDGKGTRHYIDTSFSDLRKSLENIIRNNLTLTNTVSVAQTTVRKDGRCICLQSQSYSFSLEEYFSQLTGKRKNGNKRKSVTYGRYAVNAN